jgi:hypothetical protein
MSDFVSIPRSELQRLIDDLDDKATQYAEAYKYTADRLDVGRYTLARNTHSILKDMVDKADRGGK